MIDRRPCPCCGGLGTLPLSATRQSLREILRCAEHVTNVPLSLIVGEQRHKPLQAPRRLIALVAIEAGYSTTQIGMALGSRDHTTVIHYRRAGEEALDRDPAFRDALAEMRRRLGMDGAEVMEAAE